MTIYIQRRGNYDIMFVLISKAIVRAVYLLCENVQAFIHSRWEIIVVSFSACSSHQPMARSSAIAPFLALCQTWLSSVHINILNKPNLIEKRRKTNAQTRFKTLFKNTVFFFHLLSMVVWKSCWLGLQCIDCINLQKGKGVSWNDT